jgi:hypothetical protein
VTKQVCFAEVSFREIAMSDILMLGLGAALFAAAMLYISVCERL